MSFRKSFGSLELRRRRNGLAARTVNRNAVAACVEILETRTVLTPVVPGLDQHGLVVGNAQVAGQTSYILDGTVNPGLNSQLSDNTQGSGLFVSLNNASGQLNSLKQIALRDIQVENNGNAGIQINLANITLDRLAINRALVTGNGGAGVVLNLNNARIGEIVIWDSNTPDTSDPLWFQAPNSGDSRYSDNVSDGINVQGLNSTIGTWRLVGNVVQNNGRDGALLNLNNVTVANFILDDNELLNNGDPVLNNAGGSGFRFDTNRTHLAGKITNNTVSDNLLHGFSFAAQSLVSGSTTTAGTSNFDFSAFSGNLIEDNNGSGVSVELKEKTTWDATLQRNIISGNGLRGFDLRAIDTENAFDILIGGLFTNPQGQLVNGNTFGANRGAAIGLELNDTSGNLANTTGRFRILGNTISGTLNDPASSTFNGHGIYVRALGDVTKQNGAARFFSSVIDRNTIELSQGDGVRFNISEDSELVDLTIGNLTGPQLAFDVNGASPGGGNIIPRQGDGNVIRNNVGNGISILRLASSIVENIGIFDNLITGNAEGVYLQASNTYQTVPTAARPNLNVVSGFDLRNNDVSANRVNGVHLRTEFNAVLLANLYYNRIDGNALNGIRTTGLENSTTDFENVGGRWTKNAITNNGLGRPPADEHGNGIRIENIAGSVNPLVIGRDGFDGDSQSFGNYIAGNGSDGIEIGARPGAANTQTPNDTRDGTEIVNNLIVGNGRNGVGNPYTAGKGIDIEVLQSQPREFRIDRNVIQGNAGDGIELRNHGGLLRLNAVGNFIDANGGRGVDLLNQVGAINFNAESFILFGSNQTTPLAGGPVSNRNIITRNGLEGFYVVNTAAPSQTQDVDGEAPMATVTISNSRVEATTTANLVLDIENNEIRDNGLGVASLGSPASTLSGTGLVVKVGSQYSMATGAGGMQVISDITGAADAFTDEGGSGVGSNIIQSDGSVVFSGVGTSANGRINLRVVDNDFSGNGGDDVFIQPFISLLPRTTGGTWSATEFRDIANYDRDPLARLNLVFRGNTGDSLDVLRGANNVDYNDQVGYTNNEANFKSRTFPGRTAPDPAGPFNDGGRARNSTRVADRPVSARGTVVGLGGAYPDSYSQGGSGSPFTGGPNVAQQGFTGRIASVGGVDGNGAVIVTVASRSGAVSDATNANPIVITSANHGLQDGDQVIIAGVNGNTNANGTFTIFNVTQNTFTIPVAGNAAYTNGGTWTQVGVHGLEDGQLVGISGTNSLADGTHQIVVLSASSFSLYVPRTDFAYQRNGSFAAAVPVLGRGVISNEVNADPSVITIVDHDLRTTSIFTRSQQDRITISGATNPALNGTWIIQNVVDANGVLDLDRVRLINPTTFAAVNATGAAGAIWMFATESDGNGFSSLTSGLVERRSPSSFFGALQYDGIGPSTFRIERGWDVSGFTSNVNGDDFTDFGSVEAGGFSTAFDSVAAGTFSFMMASIGDVTVNEAAGTVTLTVTLSEDAPVGGVTLSYRTSEGSAKGGDITPVAAGSVTVLAGTRTRTFTIGIQNDSAFEGLEQFYVDLFGTTFGDFVDTRAVVTITPDGDAAPTVTVDSFTVNEFTGQAVFTVKLSGASGQTVTVDYTTFDSSAKAGSDYAARTGSVSFDPGETTKDIVVTVTPDTLDETDESFGFRISNAANATIAPNAQGQAVAVATATIRDSHYFSVRDVTVNESAGTAIVTIVLNEPLSVGTSATVNWATQTTLGTASGASDYTPAGGTLTFTGNETVKTVTINIAADAVKEGDEVFFVTLSGAGGDATISPSKAVGRVTIVDAWEAEAPSTSHDVGQANGDGWSAGVVGVPGSSGNIGYLVRTPAVSGIPAGLQYATFRLQIPNNTFDDRPVARLNVTNAATGQVLAHRVLTRFDFRAANTYQNFELAFANPGAIQLRFGVVFYNQAALKADNVRVSTSPAAPLVLEAETQLGHQVGRPDGDGWAARPDLDNAGFLAFGPGATDVPAGRQSATFRMQIPNNTFDNALVARIEVYDAATGRTLAQRLIRRTDFAAANFYQEFVLEFENVPGTRLEFRTFWYDAAVIKLDRVVVSRTPAAPVFKLEAENSAAFAYVGGGRRYADGYGADPALDPAERFLAKGWPTSAVPAGSHVALFRILTDGTAAANEPVVTFSVVDVRDQARPQVLGRRTVLASEFGAAFEYQDFAVAFTNSAGSNLEFRTYWHGTVELPGDPPVGNAFVQLDHVAVIDAPSPQLLVEAEGVRSSHQIGRASADGFGWTANTAQDNAGYLMLTEPFGNGIVPAGAYTATFRLRVDNATADNAAIVTFEAHDIATGVITRRTVTRREFAAANSFQEFTLGFSSSIGGNVQLRAYWHRTSFVELDYVRTTPSNFFASELESVFENSDDLLLLT